jgi:arylsulfatase A-like enzyme
MTRGRRRGVRAIVSVVAAVLVAACRPDCTPVRGDARPNVLLVTIDTLRADHLGCYGNPTVRTPAMDRLAAEGALFERSWAQASITVPSHLSILSSLPLAVHGVTRNDAPLVRHVDVLPSAFAHAGYRTAAFVSANHLGPGSFIAPALTDVETYRGPPTVAKPWRAEETNAAVLPWLRGVCREPWFAWVHYFDPHMPYTPPPPYDTMYYSGDPRAAHHAGMTDVALNWFALDMNGIRRRLGHQAADVRALKRDLGLRTRDVKQLILYPVRLATYAPDPAARAALRARLASIATKLRAELPYRDLAAWLTGVRDVRFALARYAGEVTYVDAQLGYLRAALERLGIADRTIVLVTADHGESLGEHGIWFDHFGVYEPSLRVPLIVWAPGRVAPGRRTAAARGIDVAPTLLTLAGLPVPPAMEGRDLLHATGDDPPIVSESQRGFQIALRRGPTKLIRTLDDFFYVDAYARDAGTTELYDLDKDPGEKIDRAATDPADTAALFNAIDTWLTAKHAVATSPAPATPVGPDLERSLRALGYVE